MKSANSIVDEESGRAATGSHSVGRFRLCGRRVSAILSLDAMSASRSFGRARIEVSIRTCGSSPFSQRNMYGVRARREPERGSDGQTSHR